jgi:hypothetical protein
MGRKPRNTKVQSMSNNSISEFQIPGVGGVKSQDSSSQESRSRKMRNTKIVKQVHQQRVSQTRKSEFQIPDVGSVETLHHRSPEVEKCKTPKSRNGHTLFHSFIDQEIRVLDTGCWKCRNTSPQESRSHEM